MMSLVSIVDDTPKPKDSMPIYFEEMENMDSKSKVLLQLKKDRPGGFYFKIVTLNINAIRNKKENVLAK
jgi:hypothetical protein